jgi:hypothetical protein
MTPIHADEKPEKSGKSVSSADWFFRVFYEKDRDYPIPPSRPQAPEA